MPCSQNLTDHPTVLDHVSATGYWSAPAIELTWALILAAARRIVGATLSDPRLLDI
jgi:hypothetical protein